MYICFKPTNNHFMLDFVVVNAAGIVTFLRFIPQIKARYDYGMLIFLLTFCLISVSGYRDEEVIEMAFERLSTIVIGSCTSVIVCTFICPVWIGVDLHNQIATNIEKLGNFLEGIHIYSKTHIDQKYILKTSFMVILSLLPPGTSKFNLLRPITCRIWRRIL